jgi:isopenicillin N synthase-like dioxygenase
MDVLKVDYNCNEFGPKLTKSLKDTGFAVIENHPIDINKLDDMYDKWQHFFESDSKFDFSYDPETQAGYFAYKSENAKGFKEKDLKEFYHVYPDQKLPNSLADITTEHYKSMNSMASRLLLAIDESLPQDIRSQLSEPLSQMIDHSSQTLLRILYYPAQQSEEQTSAVRAAAHEDINLITLLPASTQPGLQAKDSQGRWHSVECDKGNIVINVGDMLQLATNHYLISTTHQVINPLMKDKHKPRLSMPLFLHPRPEVMLSKETSAQSYLNQRLAEIGLK